MTFMIERLAKVYSADKGDHHRWVKLRKQPEGKVFEWNTKREAEGFIDLLTSRVGDNPEYRVVEVANVGA